MPEDVKPTKLIWGWLSYGMDYYDATNMLSVWKGGGRPPCSTLRLGSRRNSIGVDLGPLREGP